MATPSGRGKRMVSLRISGDVADRIDQRAASAGVSRTEWMTRTLARAVLASGAVDEPVGSVDGDPGT